MDDNNHIKLKEVKNKLSKKKKRRIVKRSDG